MTGQKKTQPSQVKFTKRIRKRFLQVLRLNNGNLRQACKKLGTSMSSLYRAYDRDETGQFKAAVKRAVDTGRKSHEQQIIDDTILIKDKFTEAILNMDMAGLRPQDALKYLELLEKKYEQIATTNITNVTNTHTETTLLHEVPLEDLKALREIKERQIQRLEVEDAEAVQLIKDTREKEKVI